MDESLVQEICEGYCTDSFCQKLLERLEANLGIVVWHELLYVEDCLVIPWVTNLEKHFV